MSLDLAGAALIVVDLQNDFCPGGSLPVVDGNQVIEPANRYLALFAAAGRPVIATRDWHPAVTAHFSDHGGRWPAHCVMGTRGAEFHASLRLPPGAHVASKGMDPAEDAYSAFQARLEDGSDLPTVLRAAGVRRLFVGGLATDYCVRSTVLDAAQAGFEAIVLLDASRGVNVGPHDAELALQEMVAAGIGVCTLSQLEVSDIGSAHAQRPVR